MDAINTHILKLIICIACTCTTGKGISAPLLGFTHFSISRGVGGFFGLLVAILINLKDTVVFFQGWCEPQALLFS